MNEKLPKRLITLEGGYWRIRTEHGDLDSNEVQDLLEYFKEIRFPYRFIRRELCILEGVSKDAVKEMLDLFYDGWADIVFV